MLVLASWYPSRVKPHLGSFVQRQTEAAALYADMCVLFVTSDPDLKRAFDIESKIINGVFTVNVYYSKAGNSIQNGWRFFKAYHLGWKHILSHFGTPDIMHLNILWPAGLYAFYLKMFFGLKYIITENWTGYLDSDRAYQRSSRFKKFHTKLIARKAELITPVSLDLKKAMNAHGLGQKFEIVYNVVDTAVFHPSIAPKSADKIIFLHVSTTLDDQKNVSGILKVVKILSDSKTNFEMRIVSESDFSFHEKTARQLGILNSYVFFQNAKQSQGVAEEMRQAHCFVLFSNYENLPVVILEAMASGLPVISSTAGGVPEHIADEFGLLVEPRDTDALCKAMIYMIDNSEKFNSAKIRDYALANFSYEAVGKRFNDIYKKIA